MSMTKVYPLPFTIFLVHKKCHGTSLTRKTINQQKEYEYIQGYMPLHTFAFGMRFGSHKDDSSYSFVMLFRVFVKYFISVRVFTKHSNALTDRYSNELIFYGDTKQYILNKINSSNHLCETQNSPKGVCTWGYASHVYILIAG